MQTYCDAYSEGVGIGSRGIFALYNAYIEKEENKVRDLYNITNSISYAKKIIEKIGKFLFDNNVYHIPLVTLYDECKNLPECDKFIDSFLKSKVLVQYNYDGEGYVYINYERFADYIVAKHILDSTNNYDELCAWVQQKLLATNRYGYFERSDVEGQFAALSVLAYEKYNKEIIDFLRVLPDVDKSNLYLYNEIVIEYLDAYLYRADKHIGAKEFYNIVAPYIRSVATKWKHLDILIGLAGRKCGLNIESTTKFLMQMSLKARDYHWTLYINDRYEQGERVYNIVNYFLAANMNCITQQDRFFYGQLLTWFLSSSNRVLRDKSSRALIRLLKNDVVAMTAILEKFIMVNDPYIISRLFGCIYGALLQTNDEMLNVDELSILCKKIYESIFNQEVVYTDIMLRDYALNIIEYAKYKHVKFDYDISVCRPPYKSFKIPNVKISDLKKLYMNEEENDYRLGTFAIKSSMAPNYDMGGFTSLYGDFGRYTFQSALSAFKGVDIQQAFSYAYRYIINELGYDNKLFSEYDCRIGHGRGRNNCHIERIGKKYEWIAMYHVLALVSDMYKIDDEFYNNHKVYRGTWLPYIRDFDPTLTITNDHHPYRNLGITINREKYKNWQLDNDDWTKIDDARNFAEQIKIVDNNGDTWYALFFEVSDASGNDFNKVRQSIWLSSTACLIRKSESQNFISKIKNKSFYGRWFRPAEVDSRYNVFAREYVWSPAYLDEYGESGFVEVEYEGFAAEEFVNEEIISLLPCYHDYMWEEEYDYSKDDVIHISMPNGYIVNALKLTQSFDGIWQKDGEIACADFKLVNGSNVNGLYIKEKYLRELLNEEFSIVWIGLGEKQHTYGILGAKKQSWCELSSLVYESESGTLNEKFIKTPCGSNVK